MGQSDKNGHKTVTICVKHCHAIVVSTGHTTIGGFRHGTGNGVGQTGTVADHTTPHHGKHIMPRSILEDLAVAISVIDWDRAEHCDRSLNVLANTIVLRKLRF